MTEAPEPLAEIHVTTSGADVTRTFLWRARGRPWLTVGYVFLALPTIAAIVLNLAVLVGFTPAGLDPNGPDATEEPAPRTFPPIVFTICPLAIAAMVAAPWLLLGVRVLRLRRKRPDERSVRYTLYPSHVEEHRVGDTPTTSWSWADVQLWEERRDAVYIELPDRLVAFPRRTLEARSLGPLKDALQATEAPSGRSYVMLWVGLTVTLLAFGLAMYQILTGTW